MNSHDYTYKTIDDVINHANLRGWKYTPNRFGGKMYNKGNQLVARISTDGEYYYVDHIPCIVSFR